MCALMRGDVRGALFISSVCLVLVFVRGNQDSKQLYDNLFNQRGYNKLVRPVGNYTDTLTVKLGLRLSQILDVDEKNQIITISAWLIQEWMDTKLKWDPGDYGGVIRLSVPSEEIWVPDIALHNTADGNYAVKLMTKATLFYDGLVKWGPPVTYDSTCAMNVEFFPYDEQVCSLKFASWSYDGYEIDLDHIARESAGVRDLEVIHTGIDLSSYYRSVEWDLMGVPAKKHLVFYPCCSEPWPDIRFDLTIRRKPLFYTVNLIIPCVAISFLAVLVFYLPSDSGEKITLSISILLALTVFILLLAETIPPTSLVVPLIGKYLLFTMILVALSIVVTVVVLNVHFRSRTSHTMSPWVRKVFLNYLPRILLMRRPAPDRDHTDNAIALSCNCLARGETNSRTEVRGAEECARNTEIPLDPMAMEQVVLIAKQMKEEQLSANVKEDWKFVALVLDRLFLWIFTSACVVGTCVILLPPGLALHDDKRYALN